MNEINNTILEVNNLKTYFYTEEGVIPAVDGLDFTLNFGETLAIVGESGCGKSVTALSILNTIQSPPGKIIDGEINYRGKNLLAYDEKEMQKIRGNEISMIFQEPLTSLNPVFSIGFQINEAFQIHRNLNKKEARVRSIEMLKSVGIPSPEKVIDDYPYQLSGGMRQRVMIAMALACNPSILIADEPTTALDVTIQAQILNLLKNLKEDFSTSIILITHDLGIVAHTAQQIIVMYAGQAVEYGAVRQIFHQPLHPYTEGLLNSIPIVGENRDRLYNIKGNIPSPKDYSSGCRFAPRCQYAFDDCFTTAVDLFDEGDSRLVRCLKYRNDGDK